MTNPTPAESVSSEAGLETVADEALTSVLDGPPGPEEAPTIQPMTDEQLIRRALGHGLSAGSGGDVPIGAVIMAASGEIIAVAGNAREAHQDPTAHAEIIALRSAAQAVGSWRLEGCTLAVTVEPCTMCAGAISLARISRVVFGCWEPKTGAVGSLWDVLRDRRLTHRPEVRGGVLADECAAPLLEFFAQHR